jgi:hypothetical protein
MVSTTWNRVTGFVSCSQREDGRSPMMMLGLVHYHHGQPADGEVNRAE